MRRFPLLAAAVALLALAPAVAGAVSAQDLTSTSAVYGPGVTRPAADLVRLRQSADELAAKGFPTRFVVLAKPVADMDAEARRLRKGLFKRLGADSIDAVLVLAPHRLGIDAKVFACEKRLAFEAERGTLKSDDIQGTINVARRLQGYNAQQALRDENCNEVEPGGGGRGGGSRTGLLIGGAIALALIIALAAILARRASSRRASTADAGADPAGGGEREGSAGNEPTAPHGEAPPGDAP